jgi:hypothetical protein
LTSAPLTVFSLAEATGTGATVSAMTAGRRFPAWSEFDGLALSERGSRFNFALWRPRGAMTSTAGNEVTPDAAFCAWAPDATTTSSPASTSPADAQENRCIAPQRPARDE